MASRATFPIQTPNRGEVEISGSFATHNGAGTIETIKGTGFTVAKGGVGLYNVTFTDTFPDYVGFITQLQLNSADSWRSQVKSYTPTTRVLVIRVVDEAAAEVDVADHANNRVNFTAKFKNVT